MQREQLLGDLARVRGFVQRQQQQLGGGCRDGLSLSDAGGQVGEGPVGGDGGGGGGGGSGGTLAEHLRRLFIFGSRVSADASKGTDAVASGHETPTKKSKKRQGAEEVDREANCARTQSVSLLVAALRRTCGMKALEKRGLVNSHDHVKQTKERLSKVSGRHLGLPVAAKLVGNHERSRNANTATLVQPKARLKWERIFDSGAAAVQSLKPLLPVHLEVCAGTGSWVTAQAAATAGCVNWAALETRGDQVYAIWCRALMSGLANVCVLGGDDVKQVLSERLRPGSVARVCINFPTPETHSHLLTSV
jgi:hypothetical protein